MSSPTSASTTAFTELGLAEPRVCAPHLRAVMQRVGCTGGPDEFLRAVCRAFRHSQRVLGLSDPNFRTQPSHEVLKEALKEAAQRLPGTARILVVGCGEDYAGCDASYAAEVVREVVPESKMGSLETYDLSRGDSAVRQQWGRNSFDLLVTSSVLHFVVELGALLRDILASLTAKGMYLMAHEPNLRFWQNRGLLNEGRRMSLDTTPSRLGMFVSPAAYRRKLTAWLNRRPQVHPDTLVNRYLAEQHGFKAELTMQEIVRIVDPHRPREFADSFRIGANGFDSRNLRELAPEIHGPTWSKTYDHLGYVVYDELPRRWQQRDKELRELHPTDGCVWTALWAAGRPA